MRAFDHILTSIGLQRTAKPSAIQHDDARSRRKSGTNNASTELGIPLRTVDELLLTNQDLIDRIKICYGMDRPTFEQDLMCVIRRYAAFVLSLPATPDTYFSAPGGLLRMGLEVAFFSLQGSDSHIFSGRATISTRRHLEPRWRQATFIAGLCSEIHRTLCCISVTDDDGEEWPSYLMPLSTWLEERQMVRFHVKWHADVEESRAAGLFALHSLIPSETMQNLGSRNSVIVPHLMASISGMPLYRERNILDELVRRSAALVIERHLHRNAGHGVTPPPGEHLVRHLVDALRALVASHSAWKPNSEKSRVWYGRDGAFVVWPKAASDLRQFLENAHMLGIPKSPDTLREILEAAGVLELPHSQSTWQIVPPDCKTPIEAIKLSSAALLFAGINPMPEPLSVALCAGPDSENSAAPVESFAGDAADHVSNSSLLTKATVEPLTMSQLVLPIPGMRLEAPLRLNPCVRKALAQILDAMQKDDQPRTYGLQQALFIPLAEFVRHDIEPSLALRTLAEVGMLVKSTETRTLTETRHLDGQPKLGLLLNPSFVLGLDVANDPTTETHHQ